MLGPFGDAVVVVMHSLIEHGISSLLLGVKVDETSLIFVAQLEPRTIQLESRHCRDLPEINPNVGPPPSTDVRAFIEIHIDFQIVLRDVHGVGPTSKGDHTGAEGAFVAPPSS
jgi:hypothetical protein